MFPDCTRGKGKKHAAFLGTPATRVTPDRWHIQSNHNRNPSDGVFHGAVQNKPTFLIGLGEFCPKPLRWLFFYSYLSATRGSTREARRAGTMQAVRATSNNKSVTHENVSES